MRFTIKLLLLLLLLGPRLEAGPEVNAANVERAVQNLIVRVKSGQNFDGSWTYPRFRVGYTALNILALSAAGLTEDDPAIRKGIGFLKENFPRGDSYSMGLYACAFGAVNPGAYQAELQRAADWLIDHQSGGTWNYTGTGAGDHSVTQFAMLGLKAAIDAGIEVPAKVLERSEQHFRGSQDGSGGWSYRPGAGSTPQMTAAGLSSLNICGVEAAQSLELRRGPEFIGRYEVDGAIARGIHYLGKNLKYEDPYCAYGIERVGIFFDQRLIDGHDWYVEGAAAIMTSKTTGAHRCGEQFNLLFLAKGNAPVLMAKVQWGGQNATDWNNRRYDARNTTRELSKIFRQRLDWESAPLTAASAAIAKAPMLYLSGLREVALSDAEQEVLFQFIEDGGTVLVAPNQGSNAFIGSVVKCFRDIYPGCTFDQLPTHHLVRGMYYNLWQRDLPVRVLRNGCIEKRVFIFESDLSLAMEKPKPDLWAVQLLANFARFALREKPLIKRLVEAELPRTEDLKRDRSEFSEAGGARKGALALAQLTYDGDYNPDRQALDNFMGFLRQALRMPTAKSSRTIAAGDPDLRFYPVLYLSGHDQLPFSGVDKSNLRQYLRNGGFLMADACCSLPAFDRSFRQFAVDLFPNEELTRIPLESPIYHEPFEVRPDFNRGGGTKLTPRPDFLWGIRIERRYVLVYSEWDLGCSMDNHLEESIAGIKAPSSYEVMANILSYSLSY